MARYARAGGVRRLPARRHAPLGLLAICLALPSESGAAAASVQIQIEPSLAVRTLDLQCSNRNPGVDALKDSAALQQAIRHMQGFDRRISFESYVAALREWSACRIPSPDLYDFATVKERGAEIRTALEKIAANRTGFERAIVELLAPFLPEGMKFSARVDLIAGSNSCGMASGGRLLVDLRCTADDLVGLRYLIAHEVFHGAQEQYFHEVQEDAADLPHALEYLFGSLLAEGSALYLADFSALETGGRYVEFSRRIDRRNGARRQYNYDLLDFTLEHLMDARSFNGQRAATAYLIGFSGAFDSPFYYVGYDLVRVLDAAYGRAALLCLVALPPEQLVLAADALSRADAQAMRDLPRLGPAVLSAARHVATELSRSNEAFRACVERPPDDAAN